MAPRFVYAAEKEGRQRIVPVCSHYVGKCVNHRKSCRAVHNRRFPFECRHEYACRHRNHRCCCEHRQVG
ncbi:hypothetical protein OS493_008566 [Desmophyllum pertusum]|uniref:Uncharacterized protein n=1 Tax=Desmophyllum pertusum TaxID=174260 RepID=A0A9W9ZSX5_9CNID|nr:hypothetical protein OS493_008566 [Desmophyllum pertusum]